MSSPLRHKTESDLFEGFESVDKKIHDKAKLLLPDIRKSITISYENLVFFIILFIMSGIIFFMLGVEKGRYDIICRLKKERKIYTSSTARKEPRNEIIQKVGLTQGQIQQAPKETDKVKGLYIIQVASFKDKAIAEKEMMALRKVGLNANIKISGDYYRLYIDDIKTERDAKIVLNKLKDRYHDCYITKNNF